MRKQSLIEKEFLEKITEKTEANLDNRQFGVSDLARQMGMSRSSLHRKVHKILKISASQFICRVRLENAMNLLKETSHTVSEVSWRVGFNSTSYFIKCFRDYYGFPPGEAINRTDEEEEFIAREKDEIRENEAARSTALKDRKGIIAAVILILMVAGFLLINPFRSDEPEPSDMENIKTIAVLPFRNDSKDSTNAYFINGLMDAILLNLSNEPDLIVRSRTSVEKFRNSTKTLPELARELGVKYIVEGSGQKYADQVLLNIQVLEANSDMYLFSRQYRKKISKAEDFIDLQSTIAFNIVSEINDQIQPHRNVQGENLYTNNYEALLYYLQGLDLQHTPQGHRLQEFHKIKFQARTLFKKAVQLDPGFTNALVELGQIYLSLRYTISDYQNFLDSAYYFTHKALENDNTYAEAYLLLGKLYHFEGKYESAMENFQLATQYGAKNVNESISNLYWDKGHYSKAIEYLFKHYKYRIKYENDMDYNTLNSLSIYLREVGFKQLSNNYAKWREKKQQDSIVYLHELICTNFTYGHLDSTLILVQEYPWLDSVSPPIWFLPLTYLSVKEYDKALYSFKLFYEKTYEDMPHLGLASIYILKGQRKKAYPILSDCVDHYKLQVKKWNENEGSDWQRIRLAGTYCLLGQNEEAIEVLSKIRHFQLGFQAYLKYLPMFENVRNDPDFEEILRTMEEKYRIEHEKTRQLLVELGEI